MLLMLYTPLSSNFVSLFLKNSFPPSLGSMILKTALRQNHARKSFPGPPFARITPTLGLFIAPGICKIAGKSVYFLFMHPLWRLCLPFMCSTACILHDIFTFSQCFRHHFAEKWTLLSEFTSHKCGRLTLPARYVVFTCRHDVVLLESPALNCMLCFATLKLLCRSEIEGRRCCPPQRAFN